MRIAVDLTSLADNFSGIERYAANIAKHILDIDESNVYILVFKDDVHHMFEKYLTRKNVEYVIGRSNGRGKLVFSQLILPRLLKRAEPDLTLFLAFPAPLFYTLHSISTIHDLSCVDCPDTMTLKSVILWRTLDYKASKSPLGVLSISNFSQSRIVSHYGINSDKVPVIYCGIDSDLFVRDIGSEAKKKTIVEKYGLPDSFILSLSTIEPRKNLPFLIKAWCRLRSEKLIEYDLVLAGRRGWKMDAILQDVSPDLVESIHFTGFVDDEDLPVLYGMSSLFVFPSIYEGFGLPPLEAVCSGANVLCSDIPCLTEVCGDAVSYYESGSEDSLCGKIVECIGGRCCKTLEKRYEWKTEAKKLLDYLNKLELRNNETSDSSFWRFAKGISRGR